MKCDRCEKEATVHLTQVVEGKMKKMHLCPACAKDLGVTSAAAISVSDILLGQGLAQAPVPQRVCPACRMTLRKFQKEGRLGCPHCYKAFAEELEPLLRSMHYATTHCGRFPRRSHRVLALRHEAEDIERRLAEAVGKEDFEAAAGLRDALRNLKDAMAPGGPA
jgi:protein arginine kinase activator